MEISICGRYLSLVTGRDDLTISSDERNTNLSILTIWKLEALQDKTELHVGKISFHKFYMFDTL